MENETFGAMFTLRHLRIIIKKNKTTYFVLETQISAFGPSQMTSKSISFINNRKGKGPTQDD